MSYKREVFADGTPLFYFPMRRWTAADELVDESGNGLVPTVTNALRIRGVRGPLPGTRATRVEKLTGWAPFTRQSMTADQTRCAWVRTTHTDSTSTYEGDPALTVLGDSSGSVWDGFGVHAGKVRFSRFNNSAWQHFDSARSVNDGRWHMIGMTYDSTSRAVTIYVDGLADGSGTVTAHQAQGGINSMGRGFSSADTYDGDFTWLEAWASVLSPQRMMARWLAGSRDVRRRRVLA